MKTLEMILDVAQIAIDILLIVVLVRQIKARNDED